MDRRLSGGTIKNALHNTISKNQSCIKISSKNINSKRGWSNTLNDSEGIYKLFKDLKCKNKDRVVTPLKQCNLSPNFIGENNKLTNE